MLTPTYLEHVADDIVELYAELDRTIVRDIIRRIAKTGNITETAEWLAEMAQHSGLLFDELVEEVAKVDSTADKHLTKAFREAGIEAVEADRTIYKAAGKDLPSISLSPSAQQILTAGYRKTNGYLKNLTLTTAVQSQQLYIQAATLAEMQIESGAFDYNTAIRNAIKAAAKGGAWVQYPTGVRNRLETAVRRAVLTGVGQTTAEISLQNANDMGCDLMELTAHVGARPSHMTWQGKLVSLSGREGYLSLADIGYGTGDGFKGWNCRHDWFPFFEGLSDEAYPREKLLEYENKTVSFDGKDMSYYDATQRQRILERRIRDTKRDLAAYDEATKNGVDMSDEFASASVKLKRQEAELNDFLNQTSIDRQREREQVAGFGRSQASKAAWANKKVEIQRQNDIIKAEIRYAAKLPASAKISIPPKEINVNTLSFDDQHINKDRNHNVTREQAESWIIGAKMSATVWKGEYERYYGPEGCVYVAIKKNNIRTAYSKKEFSSEVKDVMEVLKKHGIL